MVKSTAKVYTDGSNVNVDYFIGGCVEGHHSALVAKCEYDHDYDQYRIWYGDSSPYQNYVWASDVYGIAPGQEIDHRGDISPM